jgi:hypothetical protein
MTKSKKSLIVGAALAGLLASGNAVQASNLLSAARSGLNAQDQGGKSDETKSEKAKDPKDRHACKGQNSCKGKGGCKSSDNGCKGQNSCKGKGGCRTDGKKMEEKPPAF